MKDWWLCRWKYCGGETCVTEYMGEEGAWPPGWGWYGGRSSQEKCALVSRQDRKKQSVEEKKEQPWAQQSKRGQWAEASGSRAKGEAGTREQQDLPALGHWLALPFLPFPGYFL